MCRKHYGRAHRLGHPLNMKCGCGCGEIVRVDPTWSGLFYIDGHGVQTNAISPAEKLSQNQDAQPVSDRGRDLYGLTEDCLVWTGPTTNKGYGLINFRAAGPSPATIPTKPPAEPPFGAGYTPTITTGNTPQSARSRPSRD
jgi:hypothetical protein